MCYLRTLIVLCAAKFSLEIYKRFSTDAPTQVSAPSQSAAAAVNVTALYVVSMLSADAVARKYWPGRGALKILYAHQLF